MPPSSPPNTSGRARLMSGALGMQVGWQLPLYLPNPAAGAGWSHTVDGRYFERLLAVTFTLTTSAVVANRFAVLALSDVNGTQLAAAPCGGTVVASTTLTSYLDINAPAYAAGGSFTTFGKIPDIVAPPGYTWSVTVFGEDVGDHVTGIALLVQQFPNDATSEIITP